MAREKKTMDKIVNFPKDLPQIPGQWFINPGPEVSCALPFWAIGSLIPVFQKSHNGGAV
jgi:hypothetical protein